MAIRTVCVEPGCVYSEMDGIETCRALKEISSDSRIVSMTGQIYAGLADKELEFVREGGNVYFLYKPFMEGEILEVTKKALKGKNQQLKKCL